jgi:peptide/nickel transport system permease protein
MSAIITTPAAPAPPSSARRSLGPIPLGPAGALLSAVRSNRKATLGVALLLIFGLVALFPGVIAKDDPQADAYLRALPVSTSHLFGTTSYGQDIWAQVVYGTRESLVIALVAGFFATVLSVLIGVTSAFIGGIVDDVLSFITDIFLVIPTFPLIIVIAAYSKNGGDSVLIAVLIATGWSYGARQFRVQTLSLRNRDFLIAANLRGERKWRIVLTEILPNMSSLIAANFLGAALYAILTASGLQFVGLGNPNVESWGTMLYWAENNEALQSGIALWAIIPGVCIALLGASFALLNYAFDELGNPALRPVRRKRGR